MTVAVEGTTTRANAKSTASSKPRREAASLPPTNAAHGFVHDDIPHWELLIWTYTTDEALPITDEWLQPDTESVNGIRSDGNRSPTSWVRCRAEAIQRPVPPNEMPFNAV